MRPRSRLLVKRGLPTIREGYEEMVQDMNQANSQHTPPCTQSQQSLSTQDYLLSICQLARPTFPLREPDWDILSMAPMDMSKPCPRLHRLRVMSPVSTCPNTQKESKGEAPVKDRCGTTTEPVCVGSSQSNIITSDPLEYLYSNEGSECPRGSDEGACPSAVCRPRSGSFPRVSVPPATRRKSSCPELRLSVSATATDDSRQQAPPATLMQRSPLTKKKQSSDRQSTSGLTSPAGSHGKTHSAPTDWRGKGSRSSSSSNNTEKNNMVSHWISECRSAWREAMIHACMLPALAEK